MSRKLRIVKIKEEVQIGDVIIEKGDKIKILDPLKTSFKEGQSITDYGYLSKESMGIIADALEDFAEDIESEYEGWPQDVKSVESKSRDGFWSSTDGGASVSIGLSISYMIGSGYYPSYLNKFMTNVEDSAHNYAVEEVGERTDENEDEYFEYYDSWFEDMGAYVYCQILYYDAENEGEGENRLYGSVDILGEYGRSLSDESSKFLNKASTEVVIRDMNDTREVEKAVAKIMQGFKIV